ncbi:TPA: M48 family metallopeptidase [Candidatus Woesearchaeota archaeon]|nr:M48 family metallopeptidase [Candidatus Woesearchaeota archaeon]HIH31511.1 M48 family metallopeptidase [Candidatus Woesearchaeota archaeon]HIH54188.1 M48 family metallopeptidase [Candidatus Woesearchaeota archaeon]HIJ01132.1 M48 family metallopeptidase [Candidatus Woesearchaeota archaeon]HIJ13900.1 M48 family metallopeptidase [Candidatus Woesearchaeota archaeon]
MQKKTKIYDMDIDYTVDRRPVKYPRVEFRTGHLHLILPKNYKNESKIIDTHKDWIYKKHKEILHSLNKSKDKQLVKRTPEEFKTLVNKILKKNLTELNLKVNKIYFKQMTSKWASCSSSKNLMVNSLLQHLPKFLIEYVIHHETLHLIERKHNEHYWKLVSKKYKDHQRKEKELFLYWFLVQDKISNTFLLQKKPRNCLQTPVMRKYSVF